VYATGNNSGTITVPENATISTVVGAGASTFLIAQADLIIYDNGTQIYNNSQQGVPTAGNSHSYTATGNGTIDASSSEF
jgi:hypothetical protein